MMCNTVRSYQGLYITIFSAFLLFFFAMSMFTHAQILSTPDTSFLRLTPQFPTPNSNATASLEIYSINTNGASITWYINGIEHVDARNNREMSFEAGDIGSQIRIQAVVVAPDGQTITVEETVTPGDVDIIIEPDTKTPVFYEGRALPIGDEMVTAIAIPHIRDSVNLTQLGYTWKLGNKVVQGGGVRGMNKIEFTMPAGQTFLSVSVSDTNGTIVTEKTVLLNPVQPELYFYEDNPLRGMNERAIDDSLTLIGAETTVRAEPYFVAKDIFAHDPVLEWNIDGRAVDYGTNPQLLTLRRASGSGTVEIGFSIMNRLSFLQLASDSFTISFE